MAPAAELLRVVHAREGDLVIGSALPGRGAWLCRDSPACVELADRRRAFSRALRHPVAPEAIAALREELRLGPPEEA